jgi:hypothetical protein
VDRETKPVRKPFSTEAGGQNLNTAFTGSVCSQLSGTDVKIPVNKKDTLKK